MLLQFEEVDLGRTSEDFDLAPKQNNEATIEINLSKHTAAFRPFDVEGLLTEGTFISTEERLQLKLQTGDNPRGTGFKATYKIANPIVEERTISLANYTSGLLLHLNYPDNPAANVDFLQHFTAPLGYAISLELHYVKMSDTE